MVFVLLAVLILSAALGYGWAVSTVQVRDTGLWQLGVSYQAIYVQSVADAYSLDNNNALAAQRLSFLCQQDGSMTGAFDEAQLRYGQNAIKAANLAQLRLLVDSGSVVESTGAPICSYQANSGQFLPLLRFLAPIGLFLIFAGIVAYGVILMVRQSEDESPRSSRAAPVVASTAPAASATAAPAAAPASTATAAAPPKEEAKPVSRAGGLFGGKKPEAAPSAAQQGAALSAAAEKTDYTKVGEAPPVVQFMTTYLHGDDLYDDSFSIETPGGEFLGECGVGISETISGGSQKNVSAFEVWLFDKNDIRTITKVFMTDHAFNDEATRQKLAAKGEAVLAKTGEKAVLETATLRLVARIVDMTYGTGPGLPPNGYYGRITIELAAWKRD